MNYLEQQHFNAIEHITQDAAKACSAITIEQLKGFAEWIGKNDYLHFENEKEGFKWIVPCGKIDDFYTTDELIAAYLKTLS